MTRAEALAAAGARLRAIARGLGRVAVYLGPLILAALAYIFVSWWMRRTEHACSRSDAANARRPNGPPSSN